MELKQILFLLSLLVTIGVFAYSMKNLWANFKMLKPAFPVKNIAERIKITLNVALFQSKIMRRPVIGALHVIVWWGFLVILVGSIEMLIEGLFGGERPLSLLGYFYDFVTLSGDVFAFLIAIAILVFLFRRIVLKVRRFEGIEMKHKSHVDANIALTIILLLMISLLSMNLFYQAACIQREMIVEGYFPVSSVLLNYVVNLEPMQIHYGHEISWWSHILLIFLFANILPYSKHFHVFMSVPNVFLSRLKPIGKMDNMENIMNEVRMMMNPETAFSAPAEDSPIARFGMKDVEDGTWKNYLDSLTCTQCGRCTSVCPANITGKRLSPRKMMIDFRERMKEKGKLNRIGKLESDTKTYLNDYILPEEVWACTTCNACVQECPVNINQPELILQLRRYLVMEESAAPAALNSVFANIENNGAPWQFSPEDRMKWAENIMM